MKLLKALLSHLLAAMIGFAAGIALLMLMGVRARPRPRPRVRWGA